MVEGGAEEVSEADMVAALEFGKQAVQPVLELQDADAPRAGREDARATTSAAVADEALQAQGARAGHGRHRQAATSIDEKARALRRALDGEEGDASPS